MQKLGVRVFAIPDGDVAASILTCMPDSEVDVLYGIGGAPEGVVSAAVIRALDGDMPVLAAVKPKDTPFLRAVRGHENAELVFIDEQNRDALLEKLLPHILRWNEA